MRRTESVGQVAVSVQCATMASVQRMSLARYRVVPKPPDDDAYGATDLAVPIIDGTPLFDLLADRYPGAAIELVRRHRVTGSGTSPMARMVGPSCLMASAVSRGAGVFARISVRESVVVWSDFFARGAPELPDKLHFEFDRATYEATIAGVIDLHPTDWRIDLDHFGEEP